VPWSSVEQILRTQGACAPLTDASRGRADTPSAASWASSPRCRPPSSEELEHVDVAVAHRNSVVLLSLYLYVSMVVEGFHGNRGLLPTSTSVRFLNYPCPPRDGHHVSSWESKGAGHGGCSRPLRRNRCLQSAGTPTGLRDHHARTHNLRAAASTHA
jgi:hypothetical protein